MVVLTESEKFGRRGVVPLNLPNPPGVVVTNRSIPQEALDSLRSKGAELILVD